MVTDSILITSVGEAVLVHLTARVSDNKIKCFIFFDDDVGYGDDEEIFYFSSKVSMFILNAYVFSLSNKK